MSAQQVYWPWWAGALALGAITTGVALFTGRTLGASGSVAKLAHPRDEYDAERAEADASDDAAAFEAALLAATEAEFGAHGAGAAGDAGAEARAEGAEALPAVPFVGHVAFLVMVFVGALAASALRGHAGLHLSPGPAYDRFFGGGAQSLVAISLGGLLVGVGTRMAGGCTSGHGLSGCSRLVPASLAATAAFFGAAVATSFALGAWAGR